MSRRITLLFIVVILVSFALGYALANRLQPVSRIEAAIKAAEREIAQLEEGSGSEYEIEYVIKGDKLIATSVPIETRLPDGSYLFGGGGEITVDLTTGRVIGRKYFQ